MREASLERSTTSEAASPRTDQLNYREAVNAALFRACRDWPEVLIYGEDVARPGGVFGVTKGLRDAFGDRIFDTPISESAILGSAVGAALMGRRPIVEIMWADFSLVALDQLFNQAANVRHVSRGRLAAPMVVRTQQGTQHGACAQHSQSLEALFLHVPGLRLCMPATPQDAYDLLLSSVLCDDPVIFVENRNLYVGERCPVVLDGPVASIGGGAIRRSGDALTVVTWGEMLHKVREAAEALAAEGIGVEVVDARWLNPFDMALVRRSVEHTGRLAVVHEANRTGGFGAEVLAKVVESGIKLAAPPRRVAFPDTRVPAAPSLLDALLPSSATISHELRALAACGR
jgi:pyruvate/2-oxoglutarate/acetoin dehydrogenase E1 component